MHRREFLRTCSTLVAASALPLSTEKPRIAVTMDDPTTSIGLNISWREANRAIFDTLEKWNLKICLFVCGMRVIRLKAKHPWGSGMRPGT